LLKTPRLTVTTTPNGADVYIDGNHVGSSPVKLRNLSAGTHGVRIAKARYAELTKKIDLQTKMPQVIDVTLEPLPFGDLKVTSIPAGAQILVDGEPKGTTPATLEMLSQGTHTVALRMEGFEPWQEQAHIVPVETTAMEARLINSHGSLTITTEPSDAEVWLDGKPMGRSPIEIKAILKGDHTIQAKKEGYEEVAETVTIAPETPHDTHLEMTSIYGSLNITSLPTGADIFLDGNPVGISPLKLEKIKKGSHRVSARTICHAEAQQEAVVLGDRMVDVNLRLASICGSLHITSDPSGASIYLDGEKLGQTPFDATGLSQGKHALRFEKEGYPPHEKTTMIKAGEKTALPVALSKIWVEPVTDMTFVWVPGGCFQMGCGGWSTRCDSDELPVHEACLDGFWMGKFEVTQDQWQKVMGRNPSFFKKGHALPVEQVSWNDVKAFIDKLNARSKGGYRLALPTEAQWEYAARSGGKDEVYAGGSEIDRLAWFNANSGGSPHPVGTKAPNGLGIYDMSGNVWEWCEDVYSDLAYGEHAHNNPLFNGTGTYRVRRGASWFDAPRDLRSTMRGWNHPDYRISFIGLRLIAQ
jgi:formylglycine-generating enzyme required for sulfatase activity/diacylglycerol kinase family enzyme